MKPDWKQLFEIFGVLGIIASLLFVGMQMQLDRKIAMAEQYQNRAELRLEGIRNLQANPDFVRDRAYQWERSRPEWWTDDVEAGYMQRFESMDAFVRSTMNFEDFVVSFDNNYYQYRNGLLEGGFWRPMLERMRNALLDPIPRAMASTLTVSQETIDLLNQLIRENQEASQ